MSNPKLSVFLTSYNYGQYIREALDGIFEQTYRPLEVIICDDCSTDNSVRIINEYLKRYPDVKFLQNEKNMGGVYTINRCVAAATGDYIYGAASDDRVLPGFFEKSMRILSQYPQAGICFSDNVVLDGKKMIEGRLYLSKKARYFSPVEALNVYLKDPFMPARANSVILRRAALMEAGGFRPELKWSCDSFVVHVLCFRYGFCYVPEVLTMYRTHAVQFGASNAKNPYRERELIGKMMDLLVNTPEYQDVLPSFKRTAPFSVYPWEVFYLVMNEIKYRDFFSLKLLRFALVDKLIRRALLRVLPMAFCRRMWRLVASLKHSFAALLGAENN